MLLVFTVYFGVMAFLYSQIVAYARKYERESLQELEEDDLFNISYDNYLYKNIYSYCHRYQLLDENMVIMCCTGDEPSMALLSILVSIYGKERVSVYTLDHYKSHSVNNFISNICEMKGISFYLFHYNKFDSIKNDMDIKKQRYDDLKNLTTKLNCNIVFEAHTLESNSNEILDNMFLGNTFTCDALPDFVYHPFNNISLQDTYDFIEEYNIPIDNNETHIEYSMVQPKHIFDQIEDTYNNYYPNWRENIIKSFNITNNILNQYNININTIIDNNTVSGKYGFIFYRDIESIPYDIFKRVINTLCDTNKINRFSNTQILNIYTNELINMPNIINNDILTLYIDDLYLENLKKFEIFITNSEPKDFHTKYADNLQDTMYILLSVNIMDDEYKFNLEENLPSDYREQSLEGKLYIKITDNCFTLYTIHE